MSVPDSPYWDDREVDFLIPFTEVTSIGGPFDDKAFVAGYQVGQIQAKLEPGDLLVGTYLVYKELYKQIDLLAMFYGYKVDILNQDDHWYHLGLTRVEKDL